MIKKFLFGLISGANIVTIALMLIVGYSDHISPEKYPLFACMGMVFPITLLANLLFIPVWVLLSWRRLLIPIIGFLLAYPAIRVYVPLHGKSTVPEGSLRVISYNVCGYGGNFKYEQAFDTIFSYFKAQQADIVCIQEDMSSKWLDTQKRYEEYFPYNDTTRISKNPHGTLNSVGIHSRYPILFKEEIPYESENNGSVAYYLKINDDTVIVINNHLEHIHLNTEERSRYNDMISGEVARDTMEAETVGIVKKLTVGMSIRAKHAEIVHKYIENHSQYPIISCGDFNDTPISYARHTMARGLTDCFVESGCGFGISFNRKGFSFRIDHMMCSSHFTPYQCTVDDNMDASDHYPLLCWLKMTSKE